MKVEKFHLPAQTLCELVKLLHRESALLSIGLGAEETVQIADIRYLKIAAGYHIFIGVISTLGR
jgi:hypothetical protein